MSEIKVTFLDEVFVRVESSDESVEMQLKKLFRLSINAKSKKSDKYTKRKKTYRLYYPGGKKLYAGLFPYLEKFAKDHEHTIEKHRIEMKEGKKSVVSANEYPVSVGISEDDFRECIRAIDIQESSEERERKTNVLLNVLKRNRAILLFRPEDSQYTTIHYLLYWFIRMRKKCLFIVWSTGLVDRLHKEFDEMSDHIQELYWGHTKEVEKPILIANWESIYKQSKEWFDKFDAVVVDEVNRYYPESLIPIMEQMTKTRHRIGIVKLHEDLKIHRVFLGGLFGSVEKAWDERKAWQYRSDLKVFCLHLNYLNETKEMMRGKERADEIKFLQRHEKRNKFIRNLVCANDGNTLVLVMNTEHGKVLYDLICEKLKKDGTEKKVFLSAGATNQEDEEMRSYIQKEDGWIIISSYRKIGTGFPIHSLDHVILSTPYKNKIKNLKSIGSGLEARKDRCKLYDIIDDLRLEGWNNHLIRDAGKRIRGYKGEEEYGLLVENRRIEIE